MSSRDTDKQRLFDAAEILTDPAQRLAFLDAACQNDTQLRAEVESMLAHGGAGADLLNSPALAATIVGALASSEPVDGPIVASHEFPGKLIAGRFKLLEQVGEGGMGTVWVADQTRPVRRKVALKLIKSGMDSRQVLARFEAERQALAVMDHSNIAKVHDGGLTETGRPFFVMEYVKGVPITEYCDAARMDVPDRLQLFTQVCLAVQHAHQKGIIHRDLKPSNILVALHDGRPVPKVIDFGLAKAINQPLTDRTLHTAHEMVLGTPLYMAPEQARLNNLDVDTRADVYSLGVLLYELLTGTTPLEKRRLKEAAWQEVLRLIQEEEPPLPSARLSSIETLPSLAASRQLEPARLTRLVRGDLDWIAMKALEKDRNRRYETANGFALDIQRYLAGEPVIAAPPSTSYRLNKFARKHRAAIVTVSGIALLLTVTTAISTWQAIRATEAEKNERIARVSESLRAASETQAKIAAQNAAVAEKLAKDDAIAATAAEKQAKDEAVKAAAAEKRAKDEAQKRLTQVEMGYKVMESIFTDINIKKVRSGKDPLEAVLAKRLLKVAEDLDAEVVGDRITVARLQNRLGNTLQGLGFPNEALPLFIKARETIIGELGPDDADALLATSNLATAYQDLNDAERAIPLFEEETERRKAKFGSESIETSTSLNNLGTCYLYFGKTDRAIPILREAIRLDEKLRGDDDPSTLNALGNLALGLRRTGELDESQQILERVFAAKKAIFGPDHFRTIVTMGNLATFYRDKGDWERSTQLNEDALRRARANLGSDHPNTLKIMLNMAAIYGETKNPESAVPLFQEAIKHAKAKLGTDHPDALLAMSNLAVYYGSTGEAPLAIPLLSEVVHGLKTKMGADHPNTMMTMNNLAMAYYTVGKLEEALVVYRELAQNLEKRDFDHKSAALFITQFVDICEESNRFEEANLWSSKWTAALETQAGNQSMPYSRGLALLGRNLLKQEKWIDAETPLRNCLNIRERLLSGDWTTFSIRSLLGAALLGQKRFDEAEPLLLSGYEGIKERETAIPPAGQRLLMDALERIVRLYEARDMPDLAAGWKKKLDDQAFRKRGEQFARDHEPAKAAESFARVYELDPSNLQVGQNLANLKVYAGDLKGYRALCAELNDRFGNEPGSSLMLGWALMLAPDPIEDKRRMIEIGKNAVATHAGASWGHTALAGAYLRNAEYDRALRSLDRADKLGKEWIGRPIHDLIRAVTLLRMGRTEEGREVLAKGAEFCDQQLKPLPDAPFGALTSGNWWDWYTFQIFRREAEDLLREAESQTKSPNREK